MSKKKFRDWMESDYSYETESNTEFSRKDSKRYDKKKAKIQNARKNKAKMKNSYFDG